MLHHITLLATRQERQSKGSPPEGQNAMAEQGACGSCLVLSINLIHCVWLWLCLVAVSVLPLALALCG